MRKILLAAALLAAAPLTAVAADGLSYIYVEAGWTQLQLDRNGAASKPKLDGGYVRGSFAIAEQVHLFGGFSSASDTQNYDVFGFDVRLKQTVEQPELGIGYHMPMTDRVDFTTDLAWLRVNNEAKLDVEGFDSERTKVHTNAGRATFGVRGKVSPRTDAWLKAGYIDGSDMDGVWVGTLGGQVNFTPTWGLVGEVQAYDEVTQFSVGVRASF